METGLIYVELKTGNEDGPAWIGKGLFSKSGRSIYFNGLCLKQNLIGSTGGSHHEINTGDIYWVSGVKKNGLDRHWAGSGIIQIDENLIPEYLKFINSDTLPKNKFETVRLINDPSKEVFNKLENRKISFENE